MSVEQSLDELNSSKDGLSSEQVKVRQKQYGLNYIKVKSSPWWQKVIEPLMDIFTLVLAVAAGISFCQNERLDGIIIIVIIAISAIIFYIQRFSTEKALRSLSRHAAQKVAVRRNSQMTLVDSAQVVPGDIVQINEGEQVVADLRLLSVSNLQVDESQLTGESLPIGKTTDKLASDAQIYEQSNMVFRGSFVIGGSGIGVVTATGNSTEFGNLASLSGRTNARSPIQKKIDTLISRVAAIVGALSVVAFGLSLLQGMSLAESLRFVMALAVSAVPEGLPIAISVVLVLGMRRMATKKALVRQMRAIETLGAITAIATDKTGTLTKNKLSIQEVWPANATDNMVEAIALSINTSGGRVSDPLDIAFESYIEQPHKPTAGQLVKELPFDQLKAMSANIWRDGSNYKIHLKGSPEGIINLANLTGDVLANAEATLNKMTSKGYRVIGLASLETTKSIDSFTKLEKQRDLRFEGLVGIADTLRPEAVKAIRTAEKAGVSVRMITGDHFETAYQIGKQLGMVTSRDQVFDCRNLSSLTDDELVELVETVRVYSRVIPEQKFRLLGALKKRNITAMTGDGVNDVPALSNAHIGIAMGSGSQIAKDAGDIILLDDNFKTINDAMREGRIMVSNVKNMLFYLLSTNAGEMLTILGALFIGIRMPLEPVQILWINLVTDTTMVIPLGVEPGGKNVMNQPPRKPDAPILDKTLVSRVILIALTITAIALSTYLLFENNYGHAYAQTLVFAGLIASQLSNAFNSRSAHESMFSRFTVMNRSFYLGLLISIGLQLLVFFGPLGQLLHIVEVQAGHVLAVVIVAFIAPIAVGETHKLVTRKI